MTAKLNIRLVTAVALAWSLPAAALASERGASANVGQSRLGPDDELGRLSMMTAASRAAILARADAGRVYDLAVDFFPGMPSFTEFGDPPYQFWMTHTPDGALHDDPVGAGERANRTVAYSGDAISMYTHVGTHIDTLTHFGLHGRIWNGFEAAKHLGDKGWDRNGAENIPPIVARGVLIDVARWKGVDDLPAGFRITPVVLRQVLAAQKLTLAGGDVVLVRTGRGAKFRDAAAYKQPAAGLTIEAAQFLADGGAMIVGVDVMNPDLMPSGLDDNYLPVHTYLIGEQGVPIIENMDLEPLSRDRLVEFAFIGTPLKLEGASGAPIRPIAIPLRRPR
jgi:kynurenine formamidase